MPRARFYYGWTAFRNSGRLSLAHFIGIAAILLVWGANMRGIRPTLWMGYVTGGLLMVPLIVFIIVTAFAPSRNRRISRMISQYSSAGI